MTHADAISNYRAASARMTGGTQTFTCSVCQQHKLIAGRTICSDSGLYRRRYQCVQCTGNARSAKQLASAWSKLEYAMARRGRDGGVTIEAIEAARVLLNLKEST